MNWTTVAKREPLYCPRCDYPLRWNGKDFLTSEDVTVCDQCAQAERSDADRQLTMFGDAA